MRDLKTKPSRRAFFLGGGALLGAGVATTAGAKALLAAPTPAVPEPVQLIIEREAIRQLHLAFTELVENQAYEAVTDLFHEQAQLDLSGLRAAGKPAIARLFSVQYRLQQAAVIHSAYRQNAAQRQDRMSISQVRQQASATFHTEVQISTPLLGDSTVAQMARLQGQMADRRWESGRFDARYVKAPGGLWKMAALQYSPT
jgi:hypothetical protein